MGRYKAAIIDLDGCVYVGEKPVEGVPEALRTLRGMGLRLLFLTNNATLKPAEYKAKLARMSVEASEDEILTSAQAAATFIRDKHGSATVYPIGEEALKFALEETGHRVSSSRVECVVVGLDFSFNYEKLSKASSLVREGAKLYATNTDPTLPVEGGFKPGAGAIVKAVEVASGVQALVIGKPSRHIMDIALKRLKARPGETVVIGDRLDTDVKAGNLIKALTILVLTGATKPKELKNIRDETLKPKVTIKSLSQLPSLLESLNG